MSFRICPLIIGVLTFAVCTASLADAAIPKVICAARAEKPPALDGVLDEDCWSKAEVRQDFLALGGGTQPRTTMRFAYDEDHLYLAVENFWDDVSKLKKLVDAMRAHHEFSDGFVDIRNFTNSCSIELFLDPGATMRNHYQILFNAAGQICGQFKGDWNPFSRRPIIGVQVNERGWTAEIGFPDQGIRAGDLRLGSEWGMNLVRNDEGPVAIWKDVGAVFNEPKQFGRLIIGDYASWWHGVWDEGMVKRYAEIAVRVQAGRQQPPALLPLYQEVGEKMKAMEATRRAADITTRDGFLKVYSHYTDLYGLFHRLDALYATGRLIGDS